MENDVAFREVHHQPTFTSEASAAARGEELSTGGKALVLKIEGRFVLHVLSASRKADSRAIKAHFKARKMRFASADELLDLTGLVPGSVPPFGPPILDLELYVDTSIVENEKIAFNAGSLTDSIVMSTADYLRLAQPTVYSFTSA
ncbi:MAG: YbaK/EbsC family protein [Verrucomicrobiota bacterium]